MPDEHFAGAEHVAVGATCRAALIHAPDVDITNSRTAPRFKSIPRGLLQRNPGGGVALSTGTATDVTGAAGGVVVVVVAPRVTSGPDPTVPVLACSLATATPTAPTATTALAPMTADNNLTLFC
jgi:hypothetical protein